MKTKHWIVGILVVVLTVALVISFLQGVYVFDLVFSGFTGILLILIYLQTGTQVSIEGSANSVIIYDKDSIADLTMQKLIEAEDNKFIELLYYFEKIKQRLRDNIDRLNTTGNLNLAIGLLTAVGGIVFLFNYISLSPSTEQDSTKLIIQNVQRISLVILTELFAFFFLRLYKTNISETKYFQNELTNIDAKALALRIAYLSKNQLMQDEIVKELIKTERNFVLQKEQSTIFLEQAKMNNTTDKNLVDNLTQLIQSIKGQETKK